MADNPFLNTVANLGSVTGQTSDTGPDTLKAEVDRLSRNIARFTDKTEEKEQEQEQLSHGFDTADTKDKPELTGLFAEDEPEPAHAQTPGGITRESQTGLLSAPTPKEQTPAAKEQPYQVDQMDVTDMTVENLTLGEEEEDNEAEEEEPATEETRDRPKPILADEMATLVPPGEGTGQKSNLDTAPPKPTDMPAEGTGPQHINEPESEASIAIRKLREKRDRPWEPTAKETQAMKAEYVDFTNLATSSVRPKSVQAYIDARLGKSQPPVTEPELPETQTPKPTKPPPPAKPPAPAKPARVRLTSRERGRGGSKGSRGGDRGDDQSGGQGGTPGGTPGGGKWEVDEMIVKEMTTPEQETTEQGKDQPDEMMSNLNDTAKEIVDGMDELTEELRGTKEEITNLADEMGNALDRREESEAPALGDTPTGSKEDKKPGSGKMEITGTLTINSDGSSATLAGQSLGTVPSPE